MNRRSIAKVGKEQSWGNGLKFILTDSLIR